MYIKQCLKSVMALTAKLNESGVTSITEVNNHISMVLGSALAANHIITKGTLTIDSDGADHIADRVYSFNNTIPVNIDLAKARAKDVIFTAYNHITSKGGTNCTVLMIDLGEDKVPLMDFPEAHKLFSDIVNYLSELDGE